MKKCKFYSLVMGKQHKPIAKQWDGYTDIYFNYYKNEFGQWFAIEPSTGLSVVQANTRKEAQYKATMPTMFKKINEKITQEMIFNFKNLVLEAEMEV